MRRRYHYAHLVTFDETNVVGNAYFAQYLHWQGHCRERFLAERAPGVLRDVLAGTLALVTLDCSMRYMSQCFALDTVDVSMGLSTLQSSRIEMSFEFARDGQLIATGTQSVACMVPRDGGLAPVPVPDELRTALEPFRPS